MSTAVVVPSCRARAVRGWHRAPERQAGGWSRDNSLGQWAGGAVVVDAPATVSAMSIRQLALGTLGSPATLGPTCAQPVTRLTLRLELPGKVRDSLRVSSRQP